MLKWNIVIFMFILTSLKTWADDYHFKDIIIGERAAGLGGAFIAVSDDPTGMWYNPAGIIFSFENYFSLSANTYAETSEIYKNIIGTSNYQYKSAGLIPNFFGFTQNYGSFKWGFSILIPQSDVQDQEDEISNISTVAGEARVLRRKFFRQNTLTMPGFAVAGEITKYFTWGVSLFAKYRTHKFIDNQLVLYNPEAATPTQEKMLISDKSTTKTTYAWMPKLGFQYMPRKNLSLAGTVAKTFTARGNLHTRAYESSTGKNLVQVSTDDTAVEMSPLEVGIGLAYFPSKTLLWTADLNYYTKDSSLTDFETTPMWNIATGMEIYLSDSRVLRMGVYTNNAYTPSLVEGIANQSTHVDMYGLGLSYSFVASSSAFTLGTSYSMGNGKGQAIGGTKSIQDVSRTASAVFLTGSYQL